MKAPVVRRISFPTVGTYCKHVRHTENNLMLCQSAALVNERSNLRLMLQHSPMCHEVVAATDIMHVGLDAIDSHAVKREEQARFI